jgi:preprotein translocase subunit SecA
LLLFDDVANDQRKVIYQQRNEIMAKDEIADAVRGIRAEALDSMIDQFVPKSAGPTDWDLAGLAETVLKDFNTRIAPQEWVQADPAIDEAAFRARVVEAVDAAYEQKVARIGAELMRHVEKDVMLRTLDQHWRDHLAAMDYLRQGIHLRGYAQKDYRYEYKREAFELFSAMLDRVKFETASLLAKIEVRTQEEIDREEEQRRQRLMRALQAQHADAQSALTAGESVAAAAGAPGAGTATAGVTRMPPRAAASAPAAEPHTPMVRGERKVGRNEPCPCGSGKKYKHCHGALARAE